MPVPRTTAGGCCASSSRSSSREATSKEKCSSTFFRPLAESFSQRALDSWSRLTAAQRSQLLLRCARTLSDAREELARLESRDTGKPLRQAQSDAAAIVRYFEFYAGAVDKLHGQTIPLGWEMTAFTLREPLGVTAHIIPWTYPLQIFGRSVAASLAAGNTCVVKPAEDASLSLLRVAELGAEAGLRHVARVGNPGAGGSFGMVAVQVPGEGPNVPAIALYRSVGFEELGVRKGYYSDTGEDALEFRLELTNETA